MRDLVFFTANERVDLPDFNATQNNSRSDTRAQTQGLLFGNTTTDRILSGWEMSISGVATLVVQRGAAVGSEQLADGSIEFGVVHSDVGPATQQVDLSALPAGDYAAFIRYAQVLGNPGSRVFWNADTNSETVENQATRKVAGWEVLVAPTTSPPSAPWQLLGGFTWNGASITTGDLTPARHFFFEGQEFLSYPLEWGTGLDRDADRSANGVRTLHQFAQAMRTQLEGILGNGQKWYEAVPVSLGDHVNDNTDPHGSVLEQSTLNTQELGVFGALPSTDQVITANGNVFAVETGVISLDNSGALVKAGSINLEINKQFRVRTLDTVETYAVDIEAPSNAVRLASVGDDVLILAGGDVQVQGVRLDVDTLLVEVDTTSMSLTVGTTVDFSASPAGLDILMPASAELDMGGGLSRVTNLGQLVIGDGLITAGNGLWDASAFAVGSGFIALGAAGSSVQLYPDQWDFQSLLSRTKTWSGRSLYVRLPEQGNAVQSGAQLSIVVATGIVGGVVPLDSIPDGATIQNLTVFFDREVAGEGTVDVAIQTQVSATGVTSIVGSATNTAGAGTQFVFSAPNLVVDHINNSYQINVVMSTAGATGAAPLTIHSVRLGYSMAGLGTAL